jgi:molybdopterin molybdotransferase
MQPRLVAAQRQLGFADGATKGREALSFAWIATMGEGAAVMLTVEEARATIMQRLAPRPAVEVPLAEAAGRVLAASVRAPRTVPPFRNSAMDGYAVRADDVGPASAARPVRLAVVGEVAAGQVAARPLPPGGAIRIMTGAALPAGSDAVVRIEDTRSRDGNVDVLASVAPGTYVREAGEDIRAGEEALRAGIALSPARVGLLASLGIGQVRCYPAPQIAILTTGDELRDPGEALEPGQIVNSNRYSLQAAVRETGAIAVDLGVARDRREDLEQLVAGAQGADLLVISGGVSMGSYDLVRDFLADRGQLTFWQVALRPGHQLAFGQVNGMPVLGLPGNPVSTLVAFEVFARPAICVLSGLAAWRRLELQATAEEAMEKGREVEQYYRGIVRPEGAGWAVRLTGPQGSHVLRSMALANCLIRIPLGTHRVEAGALVAVVLLEAAIPTTSVAPGG